jgi:hypothetical protein
LNIFALRQNKKTAAISRLQKYSSERCSKKMGMAANIVSGHKKSPKNGRLCRTEKYFCDVKVNAFFESKKNPQNILRIRVVD